jgi:hypothetical protein
VQPFSRGQEGIARRDGAELFHRAASFGNHRCGVAGRQSSGELEAGRVGIGIVMAPVVVGPSHRSAHLRVLYGSLHNAVTVGREDDLNVPPVSIHVGKPNLRRPPFVISFTVLVRHPFIVVRGYGRTRVEYGRQLVIMRVDVKVAPHADDFGDAVAEIRLQIAVPHIHRFMMVRVRVDDLKSVPHGLPSEMTPKK